MASEQIDITTGKDAALCHFVFATAFRHDTQTPYLNWKNQGAERDRFQAAFNIAWEDTHEEYRDYLRDIAARYNLTVPPLQTDLIV